MATDSRAPIDPYTNVSQVAFQFWQKPVLTARNGEYYTPGCEGLTYQKSEWDYVYLGIPSTQPYTPGKCEVHVKKDRDFDKKKASGSDGARITLHGIDPAQVEIKLTIWTPEQLRQLANLWPILFPMAGKNAPVPYDVDHPVFRMHNVKSVVFTGGDGPVLSTSGPRLGVFTMKAVEFLQPGKKRATKTPVQALGSLLDPKPYPLAGSDKNNTKP